MIRNVLESIGGIELFPVVSLVLFVVFFCGMLWATLSMRRTHINHMGNLPLDHDNYKKREETEQ